jgi:hypothetical protein
MPSSDVAGAWPWSADGLEPPAGEAAIAAAEAALGQPLPEGLRGFYRISDGFNGWLVPGVAASYLRLNPLAELVSWTSDYAVAARHGLWLIGDQGGDTAFGFAPRRHPPVYVQLPFVCSTAAEIETLAGDFAGFLRRVAGGPP